MKYLSDPVFVRNLVYGLEDSFISTTGFLVGITFAHFTTEQVITSGVILILVEAICMAFSSMVSEESSIMAAPKLRENHHTILYVIVMFISYVIAGVLVLLPYILRVSYDYIYSILISILGLFLIVVFFQKSIWKAATMSAFGGIILFITIYAGQFMELRNQP